MAIQRLFIANRGEAAVRVARTCRRLGVASVAAVEAADRGSLHARIVDATAEVASYISVEAIVAAAVASNADGVHPGWGFLAESPELAEATSSRRSARQPRSDFRRSAAEPQRTSGSHS